MELWFLICFGLRVCDLIFGGNGGVLLNVEAVKFVGWRWWQLAVENDGYILDQMYYTFHSAHVTKPQGC